MIPPKERPDLAAAKSQLVVSNAAMRRQLVELEERILGLLSAAQGNILEDQELVDTLAQSKVGGWGWGGELAGAWCVFACGGRGAGLARLLALPAPTRKQETCACAAHREARPLGA